VTIVFVCMQRERALREAQQAEEAASRELIQCLKAEEEEEEHKREMMRNDEALARLLSEVTSAYFSM
jgi:hypothetical protein